LKAATTLATESKAKFQSLDKARQAVSVVIEELVLFSSSLHLALVFFFFMLVVCS
jgi:hypothetical protein